MPVRYDFFVVVFYFYFMTISFIKITFIANFIINAISIIDIISLIVLYSFCCILFILFLFIYVSYLSSVGFIMFYFHVSVSSFSFESFSTVSIWRLALRRAFRQVLCTCWQSNDRRIMRCPLLRASNSRVIRCCRSFRSTGGDLYTLPLTYPHRKKSIGVRSGDLGGHSR